MKRRISVGLLFASPWLVGMVVFRFYPIGASIYNSFTEFDIVTPPFFVGLENYVSLFRDEVFWVSLQNTIYLFLIGLPITVAVALFVAMLLNRRFPGSQGGQGNLLSAQRRTHRGNCYSLALDA